MKKETECPAKGVYDIVKKGYAWSTTVRGAAMRIVSEVAPRQGVGSVLDRNAPR